MSIEYDKENKIVWMKWQIIAFFNLLSNKLAPQIIVSHVQWSASNSCSRNPLLLKINHHIWNLGDAFLLSKQCSWVYKVRFSKQSSFLCGVHLQIIMNSQLLTLTIGLILGFVTISRQKLFNFHLILSPRIGQASSNFYRTVSMFVGWWYRSVLLCSKFRTCYSPNFLSSFSGMTRIYRSHEFLYCRRPVKMQMDCGFRRFSP